MPRVNKAKFREDNKGGSGKRGKFSGWKEKGEAVGYIHPVLGLWFRMAHGGVPSNYTDKEGKVKPQIRRPVCFATNKKEVPHKLCVVCQLGEWAKEKIKGGASPDEVLMQTGRGRDASVVTLADAANEGTWNTNLKAKPEVVFAWVPKGAAGADDVEIMQGPQTLGERIVDVIEEQQKDYGEVKGDVEVPPGWELKLKKGKLTLVTDQGEDVEWSPYPFRFQFRDDRDAKDKYAASKLDPNLVPIDEAVMDIFLEPDPKEAFGIDLERMCSGTEPVTVLEYMESSWDSKFPFDEFREWYVARSGEKLPASKSTKKGSSSDEPPAGEPPADKGKAADESVFCGQCGAKNDPGQKFCGKCGNKLGAGGKPESESKPKAASKKAEPEKQAEPERKAGQVMCPSCKKMVNPLPGLNRCEDCGDKLGPSTGAPADDDVPF